MIKVPKKPWDNQNHPTTVFSHSYFHFLTKASPTSNIYKAHAKTLLKKKRKKGKNKPPKTPLWNSRVSVFSTILNLPYIEITQTLYQSFFQQKNNSHSSLHFSKLHKPTWVNHSRNSNSPHHCFLSLAKPQHHFESISTYNHQHRTGWRSPHRDICTRKPSHNQQNHNWVRVKSTLPSHPLSSKIATSIPPLLSLLRKSIHRLTTTGTTSPGCTSRKRSLTELPTQSTIAIHHRTRSEHHNYF